jgi:hypothetical protein
MSVHADREHLLQRLGKVQARLVYWKARCFPLNLHGSSQHQRKARRLVSRLKAEENLIMRQLDNEAEVKDGN